MKGVWKRKEPRKDPEKETIMHSLVIPPISTAYSIVRTSADYNLRRVQLCRATRIEG